MLRVGLTGGIGAGKSAVARRLSELGAVVIDADAIAREVVEPGTPGLTAVAEEFGPQVLRGDGGLDRERLGERVFADPDALRRLNAIVHPLVGQRSAQLVSEAEADRPEGVLVHDVPLLVEGGLAASYDLVVVVDAPAEERVRRLVRDRGMDPVQVRARIGAQADTAARRAVANVWLDNGGTSEELIAEVDALWTERLTPAAAAAAEATASSAGERAGRESVPPDG